ncbi:trypsin-like serine peptidase [Celeribacter arenosi]|uniref:Trypsin-like serine protease n=1 Tax=Celeribacter arenosi TaxID=792649 RepID=A0ABP7K3H5_9RHOB
MSLVPSACRMIAVALMTVLPAALTAADSLPWELDSADRRAELIGWEAVGRLDIDRNKTCTGTLVASDLVLTAAHCVLDDENRKIAPSKIIFRAGLRNGEVIAASRGLATAVAAGFENSERLTTTMIRRDVALIKLETPVARALAQPFPIHRTPSVNSDLTVASYGRGRNAVLSIQRTCNKLSFDDRLLTFDCDITFGSSGAPVIAIDGVRPAIIAVVSATGTRDGRAIGLGMELRDTVRALEREIAVGAATPAATAPAVVKRITVGKSTNGSRQPGGSKFLRPGN